MVPNTINVVSNLVASLQGDITGLFAERFGFEINLFQYKPK